MSYILHCLRITWVYPFLILLLSVYIGGCGEHYESIPIEPGTSRSTSTVPKSDSEPHRIDAESRYGGTVLTAKGMPHGLYRAYLWAKSMGTLVAYETFLRRYPDSSYAEELRERIRSHFVPEDEQWQEAWTLYSQLEVIGGAVIDPDVGVVLYGYKKTGNLSPFMFEDLVTALRCALADDEVGVTMNRIFNARFEHDDTPQEYPYTAFETSVEFYSEHLQNTHLAYTLFEADRMLKSLGAGYDIFLREPIRSKVPGFKTEVEMEAATETDRKVSSRSKYGRIWIELTNVKVHTTESRNVAAFQEFELEVRAESKHEGPLRFAKHLRDNYEAYTEEFPIFGEVERAARIVAISRWIVKEHREVAEQIVDDAYSGVEILVPQVVPARYDETHREVDFRAGLIGGVIYPKINKYENSETPVLAEDRLSSLPEFVLKQRPNEHVTAWHIDTGKKHPDRKWIAWNVQGKERSEVVAIIGPN